MWSALLLLLALARGQTPVPDCGHGRYSLRLGQSCSQRNHSLDLDCGPQDAVHVVSFQTGTPNLRVSLGAGAAYTRLKLLDDAAGRCVVGDGCENDGRCSSGGEFCLSYEGMLLDSSGGRLDRREIRVQGRLTRPLSLAVACVQEQQLTLEYSYGQWAGCGERPPACRNCSDFAGCHEHEEPLCDPEGDGMMTCMRQNEFVLGAYGVAVGYQPRSCACCDLPFNATPVDFGTALDLSMGDEVRMAVRRAYVFFMDWLNGDRGGVCLGGQRRPARLRLLGAVNAEQVERATERLVEQHGVRLLLAPYSSQLSMPAAEVAHRQGAVMVAGTSTNEALFAGKPRVFGVLPDASSTLAAGPEVWMMRGSTPVVGVITQKGTLGRSCELMRDAQDGRWEAGGVFQLPAIAQDSLLRRAVSEVLANAGGRGVLVACVRTDACNRLVRAVQEVNIELQGIFLPWCTTTQSFNVSQGRFVFGATPWLDIFGFRPQKPAVDHPFESSEAWAAQYRRLFGNDNMVVPYQAASTWAACVALVTALEVAGSAEPGAVTATLMNASLHTIFGHITFNANGQNPEVMSIVQYQGMDNVPRFVAPRSVSAVDPIYPMPSYAERQCWIKEPEDSIFGFSPAEGGSFVCGSCLALEFPQRARFNDSQRQRLCVNCPVAQDPYASELDPSIAVCLPSCQPGHGQVSQNCTKCEPGKFAGGGKCRLCAPGQFADSPGQTSCRACPLGTFSSSSGALTCKLCPEGQAATQMRSSRCRSCSRGTFAARHGEPSCSLCDAGMVADEIRSTNCSVCTAGTFSTWGAQSCQECGVGTYQNMEKRSQCIQGVGLGATFNGTGLQEGYNKPRFWALHAGEVLEWVPCMNAPLACLVGERCAEGSTGLECGACLPGYAHVRERGRYSCFKCPTLEANIAFTVLQVSVVVGLVWWLAKNAARSIRHPQDIRMMLLKFCIVYFLIADVSLTLMVELGQDFLYSPETLGQRGSTQESLDRLADLIFLASAPLRALPGFTVAAESELWSMHCLLQPENKGLAEALQGLRHRDFYNEAYAPLWEELAAFQQEAEFRVVLFWALWPVLIGTLVYLLAFCNIMRHIHWQTDFYGQAFAFYDDLLEVGVEQALQVRTKDAIVSYSKTYHKRISGLWWIVPQAEAVYRDGLWCLNWKEFLRESLPLAHGVLMICQSACLKGVMRATKCQGGRMVMANMLTCDFTSFYSFSLIADAAMVVFGFIVPAAVFLHTKRSRMLAQLETVSLVIQGYSFHGWYWESFLLLVKFLVLFYANVGEDPEVKNGLLLLLGMLYAILSMVLEPYQRTHNGLSNLINGYLILLWVFTAICTSAMHLIVNDDDPLPWLVAALVCGTVVFHYLFLLKVLLDFCVQTLDAFMMSVDVKAWGQLLEEPKNASLPTRVRRWLLQVYVRQLQKRPYVCLYHHLSWVTVCGNRGDVSVLPTLPEKSLSTSIAGEFGLPDLSDCPAAPEQPLTRPASIFHQLMMQGSIASAVHLVVEIVGTPIYSASLMEFVVRAGIVFGVEHEQKQRQLSSLHRRLHNQTSSPEKKDVPAPMRLEDAATLVVSHDPMDLLGGQRDIEAARQPRASVVGRGSRWQQAKAKVRGSAKAEVSGMQGCRDMAEDVRDREFLRHTADTPMGKHRSKSMQAHKLTSSAFNLNVTLYDSTRGCRRRLRRMCARLARAGKTSMPNQGDDKGAATLAIAALGGRLPTPTVQTMMGDSDLAPEAVVKYKRRLQAMFSPQCFQRGIALSSLELGLMDLVALPPHEMKHWLDCFEEAWVRNKDFQSASAKRISGLLVDSSTQTMLPEQPDHPPRTREIAHHVPDLYTTSALPGLGIMPPVAGGKRGKHSVIAGATSEEATQTTPEDFERLETGELESKAVAWARDGPPPVAPMKDRHLAATVNWGQLVMKASLPDIRGVGPLLRDRHKRGLEDLQLQLRAAQAALAATQSRRRQLDRERRAAENAAEAAAKAAKVLPPTRKGLYED